MTETQQRFLRAIAERVPTDQVVELHLFPPIRQGGVETGVAVVAEGPRPVVPIVATVVDAAVADVEPRPLALDDSTPSEAEDVTGAEDDTVVDAGVLSTDDTSADSAESEPSPYADDPESASPAGGEDAEPAAPGPKVSAANGRPPATPHVRLTIHTARYRLTLKGVDRGKWEVDVVAEADAPLEAVDAVIRGVQRRAGEGAEPDRLNAEAFRDALEAPLATLER